MTVSGLCEGAESYFKVMYLMPSEESTIRSTILRYAYPETCGKLLCFIIYRIVQAIKSCFGVSDWQKAKKVISERWIFIFVDYRLVKPDKRDKMETLFYSKATDELLACMVLAQNNQEIVSPQLIEVIKKWDLVNNACKQVKGYTIQEA